MFFSYISVFLFDTLFLPSAQTVETVKGSTAALWFTYFHICLQTPSHDVHRVTLPDQEQTQCMWMRWFPGTVLQCWESYDLLSCCLADPLYTLTLSWADLSNTDLLFWIHQLYKWLIIKSIRSKWMVQQCSINSL